MQEIISSKNKWIKELKKLEQKKYRDEQQLYKLEGFHLINEAIQARIKIKQLFLTEKAIDSFAAQGIGLEDYDSFLVTEEALAASTSMPSPQGVVAIVPMAQASQSISTNQPILILDNVQDPGNVGTLIRTADAAGYQAVVLGEGTADIYNPKVLRSMQGSQYHLLILRTDLVPLIQHLKKLNFSLFGTALNQQAISYKGLHPGDNYALIVGNEGQGVASDLLSMTDQNLYIPMKGQAESLNVAVAAGILMFALSN